MIDPMLLSRQDLEGLTTQQIKPLAQDLVLRLLQMDPPMKPEDVSTAMKERVSSRTIYRWSKGESGPQQKQDFMVLQQIVKDLFEGKE